MKQKTINVSFRFRSSNEYALECLIDEYESGEENLISLFAEDTDTGKMSATYFGGDKDVNTYFYDTELCEGIVNYSAQLYAERKAIYSCHPQVISMERNGNILNVGMIVDMPWDNEEIPSVPETEQEYIPTQGEARPMVYTCKIVGVKHHVDAKQYEELEEKVMRMESVFLRKEPNNPHDSEAIAAYTKENIKTGYIVKEDIPLVRGLMGTANEMEAEFAYMDYGASTINIRIRGTVTTSASAESLFKRYTPIEVYRANYVFRKWGGIAEKGETGLFDKEKQLIDFDKFNSLSIDLQDRLADSWLVRMTKATVENPTNPGFRMSVPLDLSVYGTSWKELDLSNEPLLNFIEAENKMLAIYIRTRRITRNLSPEEFVAEMNLEDMGETIMKRMHYIHDNNML